MAQENVSEMKNQLQELLEADGKRLVILTDDFEKAFCYYCLGSEESYQQTRGRVGVVYYRSGESKVESMPDSFDKTELRDFLYIIAHKLNKENLYLVPLCKDRNNNAELKQVFNDYYVAIEDNMRYWYSMENKTMHPYANTEQAQTFIYNNVCEYFTMWNYATPQRLETGKEAIQSFCNTILTSKLYKPLETGYSAFDRLIGGGLYAGTLVVLSSAPAMGKTALAQQIFEEIAEKQKKPVLYLNLEMTRDQLLARSISKRMSDTAHPLTALEVLQGYARTIDELNTIDDTIRAYESNVAPYMMYNPTNTDASLDNLTQIIELSAESNLSNGIEAPIVVLDYLQLVSAGNRSDGIESAQKTILALKNYARKYNTTVCVISAQNREANKSGIADLTSGLNGSAIEYTADLYLTLNLRVNEEKPDLSDDRDRKTIIRDAMSSEVREMKITVEKSRFSIPARSIDVDFVGAKSKFYFAGEWRPMKEAEKQALSENDPYFEYYQKKKAKKK